MSGVSSNNYSPRIPNNSFHHVSKKSFDSVEAFAEGVIKEGSSQEVVNSPMSVTPSRSPQLDDKIRDLAKPVMEQHVGLRIDPALKGPIPVYKVVFEGSSLDEEKKAIEKLYPHMVLGKEKALSDGKYELYFFNELEFAEQAKNIDPHMLGKRVIRYFQKIGEAQPDSDVPQKDVATFFTGDKGGSTLYQLNFEDERLLGKGGFGVATAIKGKNLSDRTSSKTFNPAEPLAVKRGAVSEEGKVLNQMWDRLEALVGKERLHLVQGLQPKPLASMGEAVEKSKEMPVLVGELFLGNLMKVAPNEKMVYQLLEGLYWMDKLHLVHLDNNYSNMLVTKTRAVIADFGAAQMVLTRNYEDEVDKLLVGAFKIFTPEYTDTQLWQKLILEASTLPMDEKQFKIVEEICFQIEVFQVGVALFQWYSGTLPYPFTTFFSKVSVGKEYEGRNTPLLPKDASTVDYLEGALIERLTNPSNKYPCSLDVAHLIVNMIHPNPQERLTREQLEVLVKAHNQELFIT